MPHRRVRRACLRREHNGRIDLLWQIVACKVENGQSLFFHETFFVVDHAVAGVFGDFEIAGVHADGVFGADFDAKAAINAFAQVQDELSGVFFNVRVWMFGSGDFNAPGRTHGFTHHTSHTSGRAVLSLGQAMTGP